MTPPLPEPLHEVWCSVDSCNEFYGWEDVDELDSRTLKRVPEDGHRYTYTPTQMQEYGKACREAALEEAALFIENGSFLHDQSPAKLFADQLAPKIRSLK